MYNIYYNPKCQKCRTALEHIKSKNIECNIIDYLKNPISIEELTTVFAKLNLKPSEMVRTHEELFKTDFKNKEFSEDEWVKIFIQHPKLMCRPILEDKYKAIWANSISIIDEFLNK